MGLKIQPTRRIGTKITTLIAVFALVMQPMYGLVAERVANATTANTIHTTSLSSWNLSETKSKGHNELTANGLRVWTDSNDSLSKAAGYIATPGLKLSQVDSTSIEFITKSGGLPSVQLGIDRDGDSTWDGYLVYEPWAYGDGMYWVNKPNFGVPAGSGYQSMGTLSEYQTANPSANILSIGYSLGSGVKGDAVISKITIGTTNYTFAGSPSITDLRYATTTKPKTNYSGIVVDFGVKNFSDAIDCSIIIHRANNTDSIRTCGPNLLAHFNSTANGIRKSTTTPFNVLGNPPGASYDETTGQWSPATLPVGLTINIATLSNGTITATLSSPLNQSYVPYADIAPADTTAPTFAIVSPSNGETVSGTITIQAEVKDESDITKLLMNVGGQSLSWSSTSTKSKITRNKDVFSVTIDTTTLPDGPIYVTLRGTDGAGNTRYWNNNAKNRQHVFYIDNTKPTVSIKTGTGAVDGSLGNHPYYRQISFKLHDPKGALKQVELNDSDNVYVRKNEWNDLNWANIDKSHLKQGINSIVVRDRVGNSSQLEFIYDSNAPVISVKDDFVGDKSSKVFSKVSFKLSDGIMADKYQINSGVFTDFANNKNSDANFQNIKSQLKQGENTITLYDAAGNSSSYTFVYDNTLPTISISNSFGGDTAKNIYREVSFGYYDTNKVVRAVFNGATTHDFGDAMWSNTDTVWQNRSWTGVDEGLNTVVLYDLAGNKSSLDFTIDRTPPAIAITSATPSEVRGTVGADAEKVLVRVGDQPEQEATIGEDGKTWTLAISPALTASTTVTARAVDAANNTNSASTDPRWATRTISVPTRNVVNGPLVSGGSTPPSQGGSLAILANTAPAPVVTSPVADTTDGTGDVAGAATVNKDSEDKGQVLAAEDANDSWSLINLLLTIGIGVASIISLLGLLGSSRKDRKLTSRLLTIVPTAGAVVALLLIEDFSGSMIWVNIWSLLIGALAVIQMIILGMSKPTTNK